RIDALLLLVAAAGYIATSGIHVDVGRFALLIVAGFLGAAGASATNHYLDRDLDSVMRRTQARPLPQHRIEPPAHALDFGLGLVACLWTPGHFWALAFRSREDYRRAGLPMLPSVSDERTSVRAITFSSTVVAVASIAFVFTSAFDAVYLGVAIIAGAVLLGFTAKFLMSPSVENAWAGYKFSGIYLTLLLLGMMADAILRIPV